MNPYLEALGGSIGGAANSMFNPNALRRSGISGLDRLAMAGNIGAAGSHLAGLGGLFDAPRGAVTNFLQGASELFPGGDLFGVGPPQRTPEQILGLGAQGGLSFDMQGNPIEAPGVPPPPAPAWERMMPGMGGLAAGITALSGGLGLPVALGLGALTGGGLQAFGGAPEAPDAGVVGNMALDPLNWGGIASLGKAAGFLGKSPAIKPANLGRIVEQSAEGIPAPSAERIAALKAGLGLPVNEEQELVQALKDTQFSNKTTMLEPPPDIPMDVSQRTMLDIGNPMQPSMVPPHPQQLNPRLGEILSSPPPGPPPGSLESMLMNPGARGEMAQGDLFQPPPLPELTQPLPMPSPADIGVGYRQAAMGQGDLWQTLSDPRMMLLSPRSQAAYLRDPMATLTRKPRLDAYGMPV